MSFLLSPKSKQGWADLHAEKEAEITRIKALLTEAADALERLGMRQDTDLIKRLRDTASCKRLRKVAGSEVTR